MEQTKFTAEEYQKLKETAEGIKDYLPENLLPYIWESFQRITGDTSNRPCSCGSAGHHWKRAVDTIKQYIKENG